MPSPVNPWRILIIGLALITLTFFGWTYYQFDKMVAQSERHTYRYSIDLSYVTMIDNVTLYLPVPKRDNTPFFIESLLNGPHTEQRRTGASQSFTRAKHPCLLYELPGWSPNITVKRSGLSRE